MRLTAEPQRDGSHAAAD